jgi:hypothetical protein
VNPPVTLFNVLDTSVEYVVPDGTLGVGVAPVKAAPYQFRVQVPLCGVVPNGSVAVAEIATPVSNPAALVRYGNNRVVKHGTTVKMLVAVEVSAKRGTGTLLVEAVVTVLVGA